MDENIRNPQEDISYIRHILEKAADDMKTAAPWFMRFGIVWLVYGVLCTALRIGMETVSLRTVAGLSMANSVLSWVFYIVLAVGFFVCRRQQTQQGLGTLALKLVDTWGAGILLFLVLSVGLHVVVPFTAVRILSFSEESVSQLSMACAVCHSCLIFLLPILPLIITAIFLENRRMLWAGIVLAALAAVTVVSHILLFWAPSSVLPAAIYCWTAAVCLLDIIPGVMLLLFARALKRG